MLGAEACLDGSHRGGPGGESGIGRARAESKFEAQSAAGERQQPDAIVGEDVDDRVVDDRVVDEIEKLRAFRRMCPSRRTRPAHDRVRNGVEAGRDLSESPLEIVVRSVSGSSGHRADTTGPVGRASAASGRGRPAPNAMYQVIAIPLCFEGWPPPR